MSSMTGNEALYLGRLAFLRGHKLSDFDHYKKLCDGDLDYGDWMNAYVDAKSEISYSVGVKWWEDGNDVEDLDAHCRLCGYYISDARFGYNDMDSVAEMEYARKNWVTGGQDG